MHIGIRIAVPWLIARRIVNEMRIFSFCVKGIGTMTVNQQTIEGSWNRVKGKIQERWGHVRDNELEQARGNIDQLVGLIQQKTGEARDDVESYLEAAAADGASMVGRATEALGSQAHRAAETARDAAEEAIDSARAGYIQSERIIRKWPVESLAVCFGVGLVTGVVVGLLARSK